MHAKEYLNLPNSELRLTINLRKSVPFLFFRIFIFCQNARDIKVEHFDLGVHHRSQTGGNDFILILLF